MLGQNKYTILKSTAHGFSRVCCVRATTIGCMIHAYALIGNNSERGGRATLARHRPFAACHSSCLRFVCYSPAHTDQPRNSESTWNSRYHNFFRR